MIPAIENHLWQSTVFACVIAALMPALRRNRAAVRHGLWLAASVKFLTPLALLVAVGGSMSWRMGPAMVVRSQVASAVEEIGEPFAMPDSPVAAAAQAPSRLPAILFALWLCGFAANTLAWWRRWRHVHATLRAASPMAHGLPIPVMSTPARMEPGVFGLFRPVLLLPEGITERLTPAQFDAIVAHELCHVRRRDNLTAAIHMLVEALFWFHPLVWWIEARLVEERERACDEEVLRKGGDPQEYAEGILNVCKLYLGSPLVCVSGVSGANLKRRVEAIMINCEAFKLGFGRKLLLAVAGVAAVAGPFAVGVVHAQTPKFEVASIRPCESGPAGEGIRGFSMGVSPGKLHVRCISVGFLIQAAYVMFGSMDQPDEYINFGGDPVTGGPAWIRSAQYDIEAEAKGNPSAVLMQGRMLQALLEDRFKLKIRRETKEIPVYELRVAKGGLKLKPIPEGSCVEFDNLHAEENAKADLKATIEALSKSCDGGGFMPSGPLTRSAMFQNMNFDSVARYLSKAGSGLGRAVINKTEVAGRFNFQFEFAPEQTATAPGDTPLEPSGAPSIFTALEKIVGLKLEPGKGPGTSFVIESVERPSEN